MTQQQLNQIESAGLAAYDDRENGWRRLERAIEEAPPVEEEQEPERFDGRDYNDAEGWRP